MWYIQCVTKDHTYSSQNNVPLNDVHILFPRTCGCVTSHDKGDFADIKYLGMRLV